VKNKALGWLYSRIRPNSGGLILLVLCDGVLSVCAVAFAYLSKLFLDVAIDGGLSAAGGMAAMLAGVVLLHIGLYALSNLLTERVAGSLTLTIQNGLLGAALRKKTAAMSENHRGELLNRLFSDTAVVAGGVTAILPTLAAVVMRLAAVFWVLWIFDRFLIIAFAVVGVGLFAVSRILRPRIKRLHRSLQQAEDKVRGYFQEAFDRFVIIKAYGKEAAVTAAARPVQRAHYRARMNKAKLNTVVSSGFVLFFRGAYIGVMIYCAFRLGAGDESMTFGTLTALLQLVSQVQQPFSALSGIMPRYYSMISSCERLMELEQDCENFVPADADEMYRNMQSIELKDVTFGYGREQVLKNASASIPKGEFTLVSGATGEGKTSLFMLLMGMYDHSGSITTDRGEVIDPSARGMFAFVPQGNMLLSGTVRDNLCFGAQVADDKLRQALDTACCSEFVNKLPRLLDTPVGQEGSALSEGQAQRLAVARALVSGAPVLLLDEPTSALDDRTERELLCNLKALKDRTVIMISHKSAAREICTRELRLQNGTLTQIK